MKYIKKFANSAEYQAFTEGGGYITPNLCLLTDTKDVVLEPKKPITIPTFIINDIEWDINSHAGATTPENFDMGFTRCTNTFKTLLDYLSETYQHINDYDYHDINIKFYLYDFDVEIDSFMKYSDREFDLFTSKYDDYNLYLSDYEVLFGLLGGLYLRIIPENPIDEILYVDFCKKMGINYSKNLLPDYNISWETETSIRFYNNKTGEVKIIEGADSKFYE